MLKVRCVSIHPSIITVQNSRRFCVRNLVESIVDGSQRIMQNSWVQIEILTWHITINCRTIPFLKGPKTYCTKLLGKWQKKFNKFTDRPTISTTSKWDLFLFLFCLKRANKGLKPKKQNYPKWKMSFWQTVYRLSSSIFAFSPKNVHKIFSTNNVPLNFQKIHVYSCIPWLCWHF